MMTKVDLKREAMFRFNHTRSHLLGLTLQDFVDRYGFSLGQARDIEMQRFYPSLATRTLIEAIRLDPDLIERAAANARAIYGPPIK